MSREFDAVVFGVGRLHRSAGGGHLLQTMASAAPSNGQWQAAARRQARRGREGDRRAKLRSHGSSRTLGTTPPRWKRSLPTHQRGDHHGGPRLWRIQPRCRLRQDRHRLCRPHRRRISLDHLRCKSTRTGETGAASSSPHGFDSIPFSLGVCCGRGSQEGAFRRLSRPRVRPTSVPCAASLAARWRQPGHRLFAAFEGPFSHPHARQSLRADARLHRRAAKRRPGLPRGQGHRIMGWARS